MNRLRAIVVDDERLARQLLVSLLEDIGGVDILAECANGREAVRAVSDFTPDLMFLDIKMPGWNGFDVIKKIQPEQLPMVIFCTAFERYALDAFEVHAVDYLVKPLDEDRVRIAVERAVARHREEQLAGGDKQPLLDAIEEITGNRAAPMADTEPGEPSERKIAIRDRDKVHLIREDRIAWVDAAGDYMCVHADGETHVMRCTMKRLLELLDGRAFKRVHRSTIVNLNFVVLAKVLPKGEYMLSLENGERIKVSRNYRAEVSDFLGSLDPD
ncbi:MAG: LytTR family DNA-binding domain-containing protein [Xanthomonadales bacterium]|nr:LytTR family DNA-binding domain-containing protein [Xanthomonadales bacterium]